jgi:hypothetical protein
VAADVEDMKLPGLAKRSMTLGIVGHGGKLAGLDEGGWGPSLEFALGRERWQYFAEASLAFVKLGPEGERTGGRQIRGGLGVRWLARSFELGPRGTLDMHLEAFTGMSRFQFEGMNRFSRPDLGAGVGYQVRGFFGRKLAKQAAMRISARVFFAPTDERDEMIACRGTCSTSNGTSNSGLMAVFGGQF